MTRATSSRAIGAKLHAMYGRRLTTQNFEEMLHKRSVGEIAAYLKNTARFAGCLTGVQESTIHRGQLEILLGRALFEEVGRLKGYDRGGPLFRIYYARIELEQIISCIGYLRDGRQEQFLVSVPGYLLDGIGLDLDGMGRCPRFQSARRAWGCNTTRTRSASWSAITTARSASSSGASC